MTAVVCPRCGKSPVELVEFGRAEPVHLPACPCYPHPPQCVTCGTTIEGGRCPNVACFTFDVLQPCPDIDPLWEDPAHSHLAVCSWCSPDAVCERCDGSGVYEYAGGQYACVCGVEDDGVQE